MLGAYFSMNRLPSLSPQVSAFTPGRFGNQHPATRQRGGMVLNHLHVHQLAASVVDQAHAIAGDDECIGAGLKQSAATARAEDDGLGLDQVQLTGADIQGDDASGLPAFHDERCNKPLFVAAHAGFDELLEHDVEQGLSGEVADEKGAGAPLTAEGSRAQPSLVVPVEGNPHVLHVNKRSAGLSTHHFNGVLVAQVVAALDGVVGVVFPIISAVQQCRVDATLGGVGMTPHRVHLADDGGVGSGGAGRNGGSHPS